MQWRVTARSSLPETIMTGVDGRAPSPSQEQEAGKPVHSGHGEVEQHEIGLWRSIERRDHAVEIVRDDDVSVGRRGEHSVAQTADHERMVGGDEYADSVPFAHRLLPRDPCRGGRQNR
jgi:hypothetical protein